MLGLVSYIDSNTADFGQMTHGVISSSKPLWDNGLND